MIADVFYSEGYQILQLIEVIVASIIPPLASWLKIKISTSRLVNAPGDSASKQMLAECIDGVTNVASIRQRMGSGIAGGNLASSALCSGHKLLVPG